MMKKLTFVVLTVVAICLSACKKNDDSNSITGNSLTGTAWFGTGNDEGEVYAFTTNSEFTFSGDGPTVKGTYTFDGSKGALIEGEESFEFTVSEDVMTVENGDSSIYIKQ